MSLRYTLRRLNAADCTVDNMKCYELVATKDTDKIMYRNGKGDIKDLTQAAADYAYTLYTQVVEEANNVKSLIDSFKFDGQTILDTAKASEVAAKASQDDSFQSKTLTYEYKDKALASSDLAKAWAESTDSPDTLADTDSSTGKTQSSKSWALVSKSNALSASASLANVNTVVTNAQDILTKATDISNNLNTHISTITTAENNTKIYKEAAEASATAAANSYEECVNIKSQLTTVYKYKGNLDTYTNLPITGQEVGDTYNIKNADTTHNIKAGDNVAWNGSEWDNFGGIIDFSNYYTKDEVYNKAGSENLITSKFASNEEAINGIETNKIMTPIRVNDVKNTIPTFMIGIIPNYYARPSLMTSNKTTITIPTNTQVNINNKGYISTVDNILDISNVKGAGVNVYVYACQPTDTNSTEPVFVLSVNSTVPTGYTATNSRKIGGFHCLCLSVGTINGHPASGYSTGDIVPNSIWDLRHRPLGNPEGMAYIDSLGIWAMIYLPSWNGSELVSVYQGVIADGTSARPYHGYRFVDDLSLIKQRLTDYDEYIVLAEGSNQCTNINGSVDPNTTGGHIDTNNRRMISKYFLEDCCGVEWQWCRDSFSVDGESTYTPGNYYINHTSGWLHNSTYNPEIDTEDKGSAIAELVRLMSGGAWCDGSHCGSQSAICFYFVTFRNGGISARGVAEPMVSFD